MTNKTRIALDIMSGDSAPDVLIRGGISAAKDLNIELVIVGSEEYRAAVESQGVEFVPAVSVVTMDDPPAVVTKEKADSSMAVAAGLLRDGKADALVSPGNTGALFTVASLIIRRVKGVRRAALGTVIPLENPFIMLDVGANTDATPEILALFGRMGSLYAQGVLGIENPRVALLNNGKEIGKGTALYTEAHALLAADNRINFIGNCEGRDLPANYCDVVVCDGFTGNIALKTIEGMGSFMGRTLKRMFYSTIFARLGGLLTLRQTKRIKKQLDHSEYGGAPFLGISKPVIKAHGSSDEKGIYSAIRQAVLFCSSGIIEKLEETMQS